MSLARISVCVLVAATLLVDTGQECPARCTCDGGIFTTVSCVNRSLTDVPVVVDGSGQLYRVRLSHNRFPTLRARSFASMSFVSILDLDHCAIRTIDGDAFRGLASLTVLDCSDNRIARLDGATFRGLDRLARLDLRNNELVRIERDVFGGARSLAYVDLSSNRISGVDEHAFGVGGGGVAEILVDGNRLRSVEVFLDAANVSRLSALDNPLICDCRLRRFLPWRPGRTVDAKCAEPRQMSYRPVQNVSVHEKLQCVLSATDVTFAVDESGRAVVTCAVYNGFSPAPLRVDWRVSGPTSTSLTISSERVTNGSRPTSTVALTVPVKDISDYESIGCVLHVADATSSKLLSISAITDEADSSGRRAPAEREDTDGAATTPREEATDVDGTDEASDTSGVAPIVAIACGVVAFVSASGCAVWYATAQRRRKQRGAAAERSNFTATAAATYAPSTPNGEEEVNSLYGFDVR